MRERIPIDKCRNLINSNQSYTDSQVEQFRDRAYSIANLIIDSFLKLKAQFIKSIQTISAKATIAKPKDLL